MQLWLVKTLENVSAHHLSGKLPAKDPKIPCTRMVTSTSPQRAMALTLFATVARKRVAKTNPPARLRTAMGPVERLFTLRYAAL